LRNSASITFVAAVIPVLMAGSVPAQDFPWEPQPAKAALMLIHAHPDDEGISFGGAIAYYGACRGLPVVVVAMTSGGASCATIGDLDYATCAALRETELRCAVWTYGLRNEPIFARFRDCCRKESVEESWKAWGGRDKAVGYLTGLIRRFRPDVILAHDLLGGEYGHSNHSATGIATVEAFEAAGDPTKFPEQLGTLGVWQPKKCYVHLHPKNKLAHSWDMTCEAFGGKTPQQVTNEGVQCYRSQGAVWVKNNSSNWGLYATTVGPDTTAADDFFENIDLSYYAQRTAASAGLHPNLSLRNQEGAKGQAPIDQGHTARSRRPSVVLVVVPRGFLLAVSHFGDLATLTTVIAMLFVVGLITRRASLLRTSVLLALALTGTGLVVWSLKWLANRSADGAFHGYWTGERGVVFPSGHTAIAFAACIVIGTMWRKARWPTCVMAAGVAIAQTILFHYLSDVLTGALLGVLVGHLVTGYAARTGFVNLVPDSPATPAVDPHRPAPRG
jgi:LmbE family N-acetylglucosaminyl deacetylase/membrane-associated phospholipid phosphatase